MDLIKWHLNFESYWQFWSEIILTNSNQCALLRFWNLAFDFGPNRPFPSSLVPLFQNESKCQTFLMKMSCACSFIFMQIKVIFIRMVSHLDSLWNRGTRELGEMHMAYCTSPSSITIMNLTFILWSPLNLTNPQLKYIKKLSHAVNTATSLLLGLYSSPRKRSLGHFVSTLYNFIWR